MATITALVLVGLQTQAHATSHLILGPLVGTGDTKMKSLALFMAVVMLATGCATVSAPYYSRPNTTDEERLGDVKSCAQNALLISGLIIGIVLFPIGMVAGIPMMIVAGEKERSCMIKSGYTYTETPPAK